MGLYRTRRSILVIVITASLFSLGSCIALAEGVRGHSSKPRPMTPEVAGKYAVYAMMASNAYHKSDRITYPLEELGWVQVNLDGTTTTEPTMTYSSGLAYDIYEKRGSNEVVWAIRGTDSKLDYLWANFAIYPLQYKQVNRDFQAYQNKPENAKKAISVTGHSLGGGLALSVSVHSGVQAITFDSSPRVFDGFRDEHKPATRIIIYEDGEILELVRKHWKKIAEVVPKENIYECTFDFDGLNRHRADGLASKLLELGATANKQLLAFCDAMQMERPTSRKVAKGE